MCKCVICGVEKVRNLVGYRPGTKKAIFNDGNNRRWNGNQCPECRSILSLKRYHDTKPTPKAKQEAELGLGSAEPLYQPKLRTCVDCKSKTPNYYRCVPCHTQYTTNNSSLYFGGYEENPIDTGFKYRHSKAGFHY